MPEQLKKTLKPGLVKKGSPILSNMHVYKVKSLFQTEQPSGGRRAQDNKKASPWLPYMKKNKMIVL